MGARLGLELGIAEGDFEGIDEGTCVGFIVGQSDTKLKEDITKLRLITACIRPLEFLRMNDVNVPSLTVEFNAELTELNIPSTGSTHPVSVICI